MTILHPFHSDAGSKFFRAKLAEHEEKHALLVSPYFLAFLQNKIEAHATALVDTKLPYNADPAKQVEAIVALESARAVVHAYEELLAELLDAQVQHMAEATPR